MVIVPGERRFGQLKERLDVLLVKQGLAQSREKAKLVIMAGDVFVNGQREDKAGAMFDEEKSTIAVRGAAIPYVGRGGLKLEKALLVFPIRLDGFICMDIGASTGGYGLHAAKWSGKGICG